MSPYASLKHDIEALLQKSAAELAESAEARAVFTEFKRLLNTGSVRAAEKSGGRWSVNAWVKEGILLGMRMGKLIASPVGSSGNLGGFAFIDKDTWPLKEITLEHNVRIVPGGSSVRDGSYLAPSVVMMPPAYVNVGAYVDVGSMIDSHVLVGSCAQIGRKVHLSAGAQIGGVLEPIGAMPVIVEDEVMVGGNCGIYEGTVVSERAVIGTGVILNGSTPLYDLVRGTIYRKDAEGPLVVPPGAVVVAGSRKVAGDFAAAHALSLYTPVIVKYRDEKTDSATALEEALR